MKKIVKLVRLSSKEAFLKLRDIGDIECVNIGRKFRITNLFFRHISGNSVKRNFREIVERLSSINLIEKISTKGKLVEIRKNIIVEKKNNFIKSYKIKYNCSNIDFFIVLGEKENNEIILISVFINYLKNL